MACYTIGDYKKHDVNVAFPITPNAYSTFSILNDVIFFNFSCAKYFCITKWESREGPAICPIEGSLLELVRAGWK